MFRGQLFILLIVCVANSLCVIDDMYIAGKEIWKLYSMIDKIELQNTDDVRGIDELLCGNNVPNHTIKYQIDKIHKQLDQMETSMGPNIIRNLLKLSSPNILLYRSIDTLNLFISSIDRYYEIFWKSMNTSNYHSNDFLQDLTQRTIVDVEDKIGMIRKILTENNELLPDHSSLSFAITGYLMIQYPQICDNKQIISNMFVQLFKIAMIAEVKVQIMLAFVNIHRYAKNGGWKSMNHFVKWKFNRQFATYVNVFGMNMEITDTIYHRSCDADGGIWIRNKSFYELEGTFQVTIFRYHWTTCMLSSCNKVWHNKAPQCDPKYYDDRTGCATTPIECTYLSAIQACALKRGPRKFQYLNSTELGPLGRNFRCPKDSGYMIRDGTGWNSNFATCACNCHGNHNKISLAIMESNVKSNKVIVGLRFFRQNRILYIQPKEGILNANGSIHRYSERWIPIPKNIDASQIHSINSENRVFFFDDARLPPYFILTGVKFNKVTRGNVTGFAIEIFGVPFDYESGILKRGSQFRISQQASNENSGEALSFEAISSVHTTLVHAVTPTNIKYVSLERSKLKDDFGQSTLPLFDAVQVTPDPASPLGGIGIFHKGIVGYAGFISLRVYGIKYGKYFDDFKLLHVKEDEVLFDH